MSKKDRLFSATEVGTLIENFDTKLTVIAEKVGSMDSHLASAETRLTGVEIRLTGIEDAIRISFPSLNKRLSNLEAKAG